MKTKENSPKSMEKNQINSLEIAKKPYISQQDLKTPPPPFSFFSVIDTPQGFPLAVNLNNAVTRLITVRPG